MSGSDPREKLRARIRAALRSRVGDQGDDEGADEPLNVEHFGEVPYDALKSLASRIDGAAGNGAPLADLFGDFDTEAANRAALTLISGLSSGPMAIASDLANVLSISQSRALTIARNELLGSYRDAQLANYTANSDVVGEWMWSADKATACIACLDVDGETFPLDEDMVSHVMCKCSPLPVTKGWDSILGPLGIDTSDIPDTSITANYESGLDWFGRQDAATQISVLGPAKYGAWTSGDIQLSDLLGRRDDGAWGTPIYERSLKELGLDARDYLPFSNPGLRGLGTRGSEAVEEARAQLPPPSNEAVRIELPGGGYTYVTPFDEGQFASGGNMDEAARAGGWQSLDDVMRGLRGETTGAEAAATEAEAAAGPFGTVEEIQARQEAVEKMYDIPMGDPTTLERDHPEIAERGIAEMEQMITKLGSELRDNGAFMRLARYFGYSKDDVEGWMTLWASAVRGVNSGASWLSDEDRALATMTREEAKAWAEQKSLNGAMASMLEQYHSVAEDAEGAITKWNSDPFQVAVVEAARQEFGMGKIAHDYYTAEQVAAAQAEYGTYRNGIRAWLRQMHEDTQQYFADNGIDEVLVFRGLRWNEGDQPAAIAWGNGMTENPIAAQPVASWASHAEVAYDYATGTGMNFFSDERPDYSMLLAASVPVDQILSIGLTGLGSTPLRETMLLAGDYPVYAIPFQPGTDETTLEALYKQMALAKGEIQ